MNKRRVISLIISIIILGILSYSIYNLTTSKINFITDYDYLYDAAIEYLKTTNDDYYQNNEDYQLLISYEGFGLSEDDNYKYAYMWILKESYYTKSGKLYLGSRSSTAYKIIFKDNKVSRYEIPQDGNRYQPSMKKMFPKEVYKKISKYDTSSLNIKNKKQVDKHYSYLESTEINYESSSK